VVFDCLKNEWAAIVKESLERTAIGYKEVLTLYLKGYVRISAGGWVWQID
jgi:hypothetical protein